MLIRRARITDLPNILKLHQKAMEVAGAYKGDGPWDDDLKNIVDHYFYSDGEFLVVYEGEQLLAMGAFRKISSDIAEIKRMRTNPEHQGQGLGRIIFEQLEKEAQAKGYKKLILETSVGQIAAQKLYVKVGFSEVSREMIDGFECIWFEKIIS